MLSIISRTISAVVDQKVVQDNDLIARKTSVGTNWTTLRVGARLAVNNNGNTLPFTPKWWFGLCSGTSNVPGDQTPTNFIGIGFVQTVQFSYSAGAYGQLGGQGFALTKIVNGVETQSGSALATLGISGDPTVRNIFIVEIVKGSPNYTYNFWHPALLAATTDYSLETLMLQMLITPWVTNSTLPQYNADTGTIAFDEAAGALDSVCHYWSPDNRSMEISEMAWVKMA